MIDKIKDYVLSVLNGFGIFLNTLIGGSELETIWERIWEMLLDAKDSVAEVWQDIKDKFSKD